MTIPVIAGSSVFNPLWDSLTLREGINLWERQGGGWRDMIGHITPPPTDIATPTQFPLGNSQAQGYRFDIGKALQFTHHFQHDYAPNGQVLLHVHWTSDGTNKWQFNWWYSKGHNQGNFPFDEQDGGATIETAEEAGHGTLWRHYTTEIPVSIDITGNLTVFLLCISPAYPTMGQTTPMACFY